jgi:hypothetical protein
MTECTFAGSNGFVSCGGLGMPVVVGFFTELVCALLRLRFAMMGDAVYEPDESVLLSLGRL